MSRDIPRDLETARNRPVLRHIEGLSAHSDIVDALATALTPLGDVQRFCPDPQAYRYEVASTRGVIFALALGMNTIGFRLDERMKSRLWPAEEHPFQNAGRSGCRLLPSAMIGHESTLSSGRGRHT